LTVLQNWPFIDALKKAKYIIFSPLFRFSLSSENKLGK